MKWFGVEFQVYGRVGWRELKDVFFFRQENYIVTSSERIQMASEIFELEGTEGGPRWWRANCKTSVSPRHRPGPRGYLITVLNYWEGWGVRGRGSINYSVASKRAKRIVTAARQSSNAILLYNRE